MGLCQRLCAPLSAATVPKCTVAREIILSSSATISRHGLLRFSGCLQPMRAFSSPAIFAHRLGYRLLRFGRLMTAHMLSNRPGTAVGA
ncbi:hypothetical protein RB195_017914 [Necator americanus]|uniref:Uncharacterized protein n=1 Tax=Necator americanus TaxID=51031 RepID=A0ABR1C7C9_NECAM